MKHKKVLLLSPIMLLLCSCDNAPISEDSFLSKMIPNWISFVAQLAALIVLIIVIVIFAYKPVRKIVKKRQDFIENNINESEKNKALAIENARKSEETLLASEKKANEIIVSAKEVALQERSKIVDETALIVSGMKKDAEKDIELAKKEATEAIEKEIVEVAMLASEKVLKREITKEDNEKLAKDFIKEIKK